MKAALLFLTVLLVACSPSESAVATAIAATEAARATPTLEPTATLEPTPTRIPLDQLELEQLLIQPGDLPAGLSGAQVRMQPPQMFEGIIGPAQSLFQQFADSDGAAGGVSVFLYESLDDVEAAYQFILSGFGEDAKHDADVGNKSAYVVLDFEILGITTLSTDLLYSQCHAVVHIRMSDTRLDGALGYARRLNDRLRPLVCSQ